MHFLDVLGHILIDLAMNAQQAHVYFFCCMLQPVNEAWALAVWALRSAMAAFLCWISVCIVCTSVAQAWKPQKARVVWIASCRPQSNVQ